MCTAMPRPRRVAPAQPASRFFDPDAALWRRPFHFPVELPGQCGCAARAICWPPRHGYRPTPGPPHHCIFYSRLPAWCGVAGAAPAITRCPVPVPPKPLLPLQFSLCVTPMLAAIAAGNIVYVRACRASMCAQAAAPGLPEPCAARRPRARPLTTNHHHHQTTGGGACCFAATGPVRPTAKGAEPLLSFVLSFSCCCRAAAHGRRARCPVRGAASQSRRRSASTRVLCS